MFDNLLVALGISSPILIALSAGIFYSLKNIFERRLDIYKEKTLEKFKDEITLKNIEFQHSLSLEFDKVRIIHDRQKEVLTEILNVINNLIVDVFDSYIYEDAYYPLFPDTKYQKAKKAVYANGLFVNSDSLRLLNTFFDVFQKNTDWIYSAIGHDDEMHFSRYDIHFLELIQNEIFKKFRWQLGIDERPPGEDYLNSIEVIGILCKNRDLFNETIIFEKVFKREDEIYSVIKEIRDDKTFKAELSNAFEISISKDKHHRYSQEDINIIKNNLNK